MWYVAVWKFTVKKRKIGVEGKVPITWVRMHKKGASSPTVSPPLPHW